MTKIYGVVHHALTTTYDAVAKYAKRYNLPDKNIAIVENHTAALPRCPILIFTDYVSLRKFSKSLEGKKALVLVVDTLPQLYGIKDIEFLDCSGGQDGLSYRFKPQPLNLNLLRQQVKRASKKRVDPISFSIGEFNIIPPLISAIKQGMILDKLNNLVYKTPDVTKRDRIKRIFINHLVGSMSLVDLRKELSSMFKRGLALKFVADLCDFLETDSGKAYVTAVSKLASHSKKTPIKLDKLSADCGVDHFELRYLSRLYKSLNTKKQPQLGKLHLLTGVVQDRRSNKHGTKL